MRYVFKILALSSEPSAAISYISNAFGEMGEDKTTYSEWYNEINVVDDVCDLELNVITDIINTDFDETIASIDGIVYFLNPLRKGESDFFEMILPIIYSVKRDIPTIIVFYDEMGFLPVSINVLLENIWTNYPDLEAFVNISPSEFQQVIECLCMAMITGDTPLNIENAWMRFPIFIKLANQYFQNQNLYYAAQTLKKMALIANIYEKQEFFIYSEQAAYLYAKLNLFLEASQILEAIDTKKSNEFKKMYADAIIREGNILFNKNNFEMAAFQYESAGQWTSIELKDKDMISQSFKLAINSWISACKCEKAFLILERLPHKEIAPILNEIVDKIIAAADYLVSIGSLNSAREQLYYSVHTYQREGLSETVKKLTQKLSIVLITIFKSSIKNQEITHARSIYEEIENLWESYTVEKVDLDSSLENLIK
jgi:tetratricopeptide (TPR) repeat protein